MKKFAYVIAVLAAAFAVSCTKETPLETPNTDAPAEVGMKEVTITASIDPETKTSYDADGKFSWTAGDQISIKGSDNVFYTFTASESAASSTFTGMIPEGISLQKHALYPANELNAQNGDGSYAFCLPEYKDLTGCSSAEIPMSSYVSSGVYNFKHMTGAALLTFNNIPDQFVSVEITVKANSVRLSGILKLWSGAPFSWSAATAQNDSEKTFTRKVSVNNNQAELYLPYRGEFWDNCTINIVGFDAEGNTGVLLKDKTMKGSSENVYNPGLVIPYAALELPTYVPSVDWSKVDWTAENVVSWTQEDWMYSSYPQYSDIKEMKAYADENFVYVQVLPTKNPNEIRFFFANEGTNKSGDLWMWENTLYGTFYKSPRATISDNMFTLYYNDFEVFMDYSDSKWNMAFPRVAGEYTASSGYVYIGIMTYGTVDEAAYEAPAPKVFSEMIKVALP